MSNMPWNDMSWEILDIARHHSWLAYTLFFIDGVAYVTSYRMDSEDKNRSMYLVLCPLIILLISLFEIVFSILIINIYASTKAVDIIISPFLFLFLPPTNFIFAYFLLRNWRASQITEVKPIHWIWFIFLMLIHVPMGALTLAL